MQISIIAKSIRAGEKRERDFTSKAFPFNQLLLALRMPKTFFISNLRRSRSVICSLITLIWFEPLKMHSQGKSFSVYHNVGTSQRRNVRDGKKLNEKTEIREIGHRQEAKRANEMNKTKGRTRKKN